MRQNFGINSFHFHILTDLRALRLIDSTGSLMFYGNWLTTLTAIQFRGETEPSLRGALKSGLTSADSGASWVWRSRKAVSSGGPAHGSRQPGEDTLERRSDVIRRDDEQSPNE